MAFYHQFISEDPANCGFSLHYFVMLHSCTLSADACRPNLHIGKCTESKGSVHPSLVLGCIPPAASCTYFFLLPAITSTCTIFCSPWDILGMCILHSSPSTQFCPHTRTSHCTVHVGVPTTYKVFTTVSFLLDHPPPVPGPLSQFQMYRVTNKSPIHCNGIIPFQTSPHDATQVQNAVATCR